jgi:hypothetical protein
VIRNLENEKVETANEIQTVDELSIFYRAEEKGYRQGEYDRDGYLVIGGVQYDVEARLRDVSLMYPKLGREGVYLDIVTLRRWLLNGRYVLFSPRFMAKSQEDGKEKLLVTQFDNTRIERCLQEKPCLVKHKYEQPPDWCIGIPLLSFNQVCF